MTGTLGVELPALEARAGAPEGPHLEPWVERARLDEPGAWTHLYRRYYPHVLRDMAQRVGDGAMAEDLAQETFVRAMRGIAGYRGQASFATWLRRIALNVARRHWRCTSTRRRTAEGLAHAAEPSLTPSPEDAHTQATRARALLSALDELPPKLREAFVLRDLEGLAPCEAARRLAISPGHLAVRSHRARAKLHAELAARGWVDGPALRRHGTTRTAP